MSDNTKTNMPPRRGPMGGHGMGAVEKAKDFKGTIGKLLKYMGRHWITLIFIILFAGGSAAFGVIGPKIMGKATTCTT